MAWEGIAVAILIVGYPFRCTCLAIVAQGITSLALRILSLAVGASQNGAAAGDVRKGRFDIQKYARGRNEGYEPCCRL